MDKPEPTIDVTREVFETANKLRTLDNLRGLEAKDYANIIAGFYRQLVIESEEDDPDDVKLLPERQREMEFWQAVSEYFIRQEVEGAVAEINIIDSDED